MICARLTGGPCHGLDYHFMAADEPPEVMVMGRVRGTDGWVRLTGSMIRDRDFDPQTYRLAEPLPVAMDDDGEPVFEFRHS